MLHELKSMVRYTITALRPMPIKFLVSAEFIQYMKYKWSMLGSSSKKLSFYLCVPIVLGRKKSGSKINIKFYIYISIFFPSSRNHMSVLHWSPPVYIQALYNSYHTSKTYVHPCSPITLSINVNYLYLSISSILSLATSFYSRLSSLFISFIIGHDDGDTERIRERRSALYSFLVRRIRIDIN